MTETENLYYNNSNSNSNSNFANMVDVSSVGRSDSSSERLVNNNNTNRRFPGISEGSSTESGGREDSTGKFQVLEMKVNEWFVDFIFHLTKNAFYCGAFADVCGLRGLFHGNHVFTPFFTLVGTRHGTA